MRIKSDDTHKGLSTVPATYQLQLVITNYNVSKVFFWIILDKYFCHSVSAQTSSSRRTKSKSCFVGLNALLKIKFIALSGWHSWVEGRPVTKRLWVRSCVRVCTGGNQSMPPSPPAPIPLSLKSIKTYPQVQIKKNQVYSCECSSSTK